jgi:hypothetical protein
VLVLLRRNNKALAIVAESSSFFISAIFLSSIVVGRKPSHGEIFFKLCLEHCLVFSLLPTKDGWLDHVDSSEDVINCWVFFFLSCCFVVGWLVEYRMFLFVCLFLEKNTAKLSQKQ